MSINPVLVKNVHTMDLIPLCANDEGYILVRPGVHFTLKLPNRTLNGKGSIFVTTHRLVFVKDEGSEFDKVFSSLSLPFALLKEPRFHQPIFRTNHFDGIITPEITAKFPLEADGTFSITFSTGGCSVFLAGFYMYYAKVHNDPNFRAPSNPIVMSDEEHYALVDPNDPSQVYFTQPQVFRDPCVSEGKQQDQESGQPAEGTGSTNESNNRERPIFGREEATIISHNTLFAGRF